MSDHFDIERIGDNPQAFRVILNDVNQRVPLPALWLRERTQDKDQVDLLTGQRLFDPHQLDDKLYLSEASIQDDALHVVFSDGHATTFNTGWLRSESHLFDQKLPEKVAWQSNSEIDARYDWLKVKTDERIFLQSLHAFLSYGYIILYNTPTAENTLLALASKYGYIRETNFGRHFEVYSRPDANDLAYTSYAIGPHTDNPYRDPVPGIQMLHCLVNETEGGLSTLVDSVKVGETLKREDPEAFDLLAKIPVRYRFRDPSTSLIDFHPLIDLDRQGHIAGIHYSPRLDDTPLLEESQFIAFHRARKKLSGLLNSPEMEKRFLLKAGEMMMFDNNRVLHGRTSFDPTQGRRHLQGCYIDRDAPKSLYRMIQQKLASAAE